jgi:hypothetical protein
VLGVAFAVSHEFEVVLALEGLLVDVVELGEEVRGEGAAVLAGHEQLALQLLREGGLQRLPALPHLNITGMIGTQ